MDALIEATKLVFDPFVLWVILASSAFGIFVGAMPGLTATMATALLVPVTFFMATGPCPRRHRHRDRHGNFRRRHSRRDAAHARYAGLGGLHGRELCHGAKGPPTE